MIPLRPVTCESVLAASRLAQENTTRPETDSGNTQTQDIANAEVFLN